ncbi:MAG: glycerol-3-phosphate acyltransferase [bacterium]
MSLDSINSLSVYPLIALIGYVIGSTNMAHFLARLRGVDIRAGGSGNPGASNALVLMGWKAAILVGAYDIGKAVLAVWLVRLLFPGSALCGTAAGVACVIGHIYPFYLRFRGGKGFASYLGMTLALNWKFALVLLLAVLVLLLVTDYIVVGTMTAVISFPAYSVMTQHYAAAALLCVASGIMIWKHRANLARIVNGTEIGFRSAKSGEHRVK